MYRTEPEVVLKILTVLISSIDMDSFKPCGRIAHDTEDPDKAYPALDAISSTVGMRPLMLNIVMLGAFFHGKLKRLLLAG